MDTALATLTGLPPALLYAIVLAVAFIENFIPPFPADVTVAFGMFLAARGGRAMTAVFAAALVGNTIGAMVVYAAASRYGASRFELYLGLRNVKEREARLMALLKRFGVPALFLARFVPGVRALVPAVAGALRMPPLPTAAMLVAASTAWYGGITLIVVRVEEWAEVEGRLAGVAGGAAVLSVGTLLIGTVVWLILRSRKPR